MRQSTLATGLSFIFLSSLPAQSFALRPARLFEVGSGVGIDLCLRALGPHEAGVHFGIDRCDGDPGTRFHREGDALLVGDLCLSESQGGRVAGASVVAARCDGGADQAWTISRERAIRGAHGQCMEVRGGRSMAGTPVLLAACQDSAEQRWEQRPLGRHIAHAGSCLAVLDGSDVEAPVSVRHCEESESEAFLLEGDHFEVGGLCLGIREERLLAVRCNDPRVRPFSIARDGTFRSGADRCLEAIDEGPTAGTRVLLRKCDGRADQLWFYETSMPHQHGLPLPQARPLDALPPPLPGTEVLRPAALKALAFSMDAEPLARGKLRVLRSAVEGHRLQVAQVEVIVDLFVLPDDKFDAIRILRNVIVDPQRNERLLRHFEFAVDRQAVRQLVQH